VRLKRPDGFDAIASDFDLETARASVAYKLVSARSTSSGCVVSSLRGCLRVSVPRIIFVFGICANKSLMERDLPRWKKNWSTSGFCTPLPDRT
jgi:hypothetical protein